MDRTLLQHLPVLESVARNASFRAAARELTVAPSAVSHAISLLEERLGVRLLSRSTRSVTLTEEGQGLLERLSPALAEISSALEETSERAGHPRGNLRLTVSHSALHLALGPRLASFAQAYPQITLTSMVDDRFTDVVSGGFDAGVRLGESLQPDMIAVPIGPRLRSALVASPAFLDSLPALPAHPRNLLDHPCIRFRFSSGTNYSWEFERNGKEVVLPLNGPIVVNDNLVVARAAIDGAGFAFLFEDYVREAIADGRLVRLLEDWCQPFDGFHVYYPSRRQMRPALRAFIDYFRQDNL